MGNLVYGQKFDQKTFWGKTQKEAYLSACKWYASNVIAKDDLHNVQVEFKKEKDKNAVTIVLFSVLSEKEVMGQHCKCCKEMHKSFFINEDTNCDRCSAISFQKRLRQKMQVKVSCYRTILKKALERRKGK